MATTIVPGGSTGSTGSKTTRMIIPRTNKTTTTTFGNNSVAAKSGGGGILQDGAAWEESEDATSSPSRLLDRPLLDPNRSSREKSDVDARFEPRKRRLRRLWNASGSGSSNNNTTSNSNNKQGVSSTSASLSSSAGEAGAGLSRRSSDRRAQGISAQQRPSAPTLFIDRTTRVADPPQQQQKQQQRQQQQQQARTATSRSPGPSASAVPSASPVPRPLGENPKDTGKKCRLIPVPTRRHRNVQLSSSSSSSSHEDPPAASASSSLQGNTASASRTADILSKDLQLLDELERSTRARGVVAPDADAAGASGPSPRKNHPGKRAARIAQFANTNAHRNDSSDRRATVGDRGGHDGGSGGGVCDSDRDVGDDDDDTRSSTSVRSLSDVGEEDGMQPQKPQHHKGTSSLQAVSPARTAATCPTTQDGSGLRSSSSSLHSSSVATSQNNDNNNSSRSHNGSSQGQESSHNSNSNNNNPYVPHHLVDLDTCGDEEAHSKRVREVLRRPFGRNSLGKLARQYCVVVNPPELGPSSNDNNAARSSNQKVWKYRVWVQQPNLKQAKTRQALTTALIDRTLSDFFYLERSLRDEYHGAALIPSLHNYLHQHHHQNPRKNPSAAAATGGRGGAVGTASVPNPPPQPLQDFLADLTNGIRGQGEFYIPPDHVLKSRSLEAFLYKSNLQQGDNDHDVYEYGPSTPGSTGHSTTSTTASSSHRSSRRGGPRTPASRHQQQHLHDAWLQYFFRPIERFCGGVESTTAGFFFLSRADEFSCGDGESTLVTSSPTHNSDPAHAHARGASRGSYPNNSAYMRDGYDEYHQYRGQDSSRNHHAPPYSSSNVIHCELLEAEGALLASYNSLTGSLLEKIQRLDEIEVKASQHWRRLATCLQTIFVAEKDTETVKLDDNVRVKSPFRKIPRAPVESAIQALASCYSSRYSTTYDTLRVMLVAFSSDLDSIPLAMASYRSAMEAESTVRDERDFEEDEDIDRDPSRRNRLVLHETWLRHTLTAFCRSLPIRTSRMAWRYWNTCASQCAALASSATLVSSQTTLDAATSELVHKQLSRHVSESRKDDEKEVDLIGRIVAVNSKREAAGRHDSQHSIHADGGTSGLDSAAIARHTKVLNLARQRLGRWDSQLSLAIMGAVGVTNASLDEAMGRDLKRIRKYAIGLREQLNRCTDCVKALQSMSPRMLVQRKDMLVDMAKLFSGKPQPHPSSQKRSVSPSMAILARAGVDTTDPLGWSAALPNYDPLTASPKKKHHLSVDHIPVGELAVSFLNARDSHMEDLLDGLLQLLKEYYTRVEVIEGYVYMECVGNQMERHFSQQRSTALTAFEKKTDITAALNIANRKRLHKLKEELQEKLVQLGDVSHTVVKETKELHLESKSLKAELHELAIRRLTRARETSTERIVQILSRWAKETENTAATELKALGEAMATLERAIGQESALFYPPKSE
jgi:hypothetical protein